MLRQTKLGGVEDSMFEIGESPSSAPILEGVEDAATVEQRLDVLEQYHPRVSSVSNTKNVAEQGSMIVLQGRAFASLTERLARNARRHEVYWMRRFPTHDVRVDAWTNVGAVGENGVRIEFDAGDRETGALETEGESPGPRAQIQAVHDG